MLSRLGWRRPDKPEGSPEAGTSTPPARDALAAAPPLPPRGADGPRPMHTAPSSCCGSSDCSDGDYLPGGGAEPAAGGEPTPVREPCCAACSLERATVRAKAAFFDALSRGAELDPFSGCSPQQPEARDRGAQQQCGAPAPSTLLHHTCGLSGSDAADRRQRQGGAPPRHEGDVARRVALEERQTELEGTVRHLQEQLAASEAARKAIAASLTRKAKECENVTRVVKELAEGRSKTVAARAAMQDKYGELQCEYARTLRVADLSRAASKENVARTGRALRTMRQSQAELAAARKHAAAMAERARKARVENGMLKEKLAVLERLGLEEVQESAVMREFSRYRLGETY